MRKKEIGPNYQGPPLRLVEVELGDIKQKKIN